MNIRLILPVLLLGIVLIGCRDKRLSTTEMPWHEGTFSQAQEQAGNKDLMVFFETEW